MTDEFVDFYEILELPIEAERADIRKRIGELYVEAQKNLDHRNFETRVRNQQLFEITLPQARYILLNDGRRDDYDRLVKASRAPVAHTPTATPAQLGETANSTDLEDSAPATAASDFRLSEPARSTVAGSAPTIDALPDEASDPATVVREREELWNKWKSGLQSAMEREAAKEGKFAKSSASATTPLADRIEAAQSGARQPQTQLEALARPNAANAAPETAQVATAARSKSQPKPERPKVKFDFGGGSQAEADDAPRRGEGAPVPGAEEFVEAAKGRLSPEQIQERRDNHRREIMREELENTGVKGVILGAGIIAVPGIFALAIFMSVNYPHDKLSTLPIKSAGLAWFIGLLVLSGLAYACARLLSKSLRRKQALQLSLMSYEDLLRRTNKDI